MGRRAWLGWIVRFVGYREFEDSDFYVKFWVRFWGRRDEFDFVFVMGISSFRDRDVIRIYTIGEEVGVG